MSTLQVINIGTLTQILVNNLPPPPPPPLPQAMLSFDDQRHIHTRKTIYLHLSALYWGEGGLRSNCTLKNKYSSTKWFFGNFLDGFHKCPNYFSPPCRSLQHLLANILILRYAKKSPETYMVCPGVWIKKLNLIKHYCTLFKQYLKKKNTHRTTEINLTLFRIHDYYKIKIFIFSLSMYLFIYLFNDLPKAGEFTTEHQVPYKVSHRQPSPVKISNPSHRHAPVSKKILTNYWPIKVT